MGGRWAGGVERRGDVAAAAPRCRHHHHPACSPSTRNGTRGIPLRGVRRGRGPAATAAASFWEREVGGGGNAAAGRAVVHAYGAGMRCRGGGRGKERGGSGGGGGWPPGSPTCPPARLPARAHLNPAASSVCARPPPRSRRRGPPRRVCVSRAHRCRLGAPPAAPRPPSSRPPPVAYFLPPPPPPVGPPPPLSRCLPARAAPRRAAAAVALPPPLPPIPRRGGRVACRAACPAAPAGCLSDRPHAHLPDRPPVLPRCAPSLPRLYRRAPRAVLWPADRVPALSPSRSSLETRAPVVEGGRAGVGRHLARRPRPPFPPPCLLSPLTPTRAQVQLPPRCQWRCWGPCSPSPWPAGSLPPRDPSRRVGGAVRCGAGRRRYLCAPRSSRLSARPHHRSRVRHPPLCNPAAARWRHPPVATRLPPNGWRFLPVLLAATPVCACRRAPALVRSPSRARGVREFPRRASPPPRSGDIPAALRYPAGRTWRRPLWSGTCVHRRLFSLAHVSWYRRWRAPPRFCDNLGCRGANGWRSRLACGGTCEHHRPSASRA